MTEKQSEDKPKTLYHKLVEIMSEMGRVEKKGYNAFHKYAYVTESDLTDALRDKLAIRNVIIIPSLENVQHEDTLTTISMTFVLVDADSGEKHEVKWGGTGDDRGDKGLYKAYTGALKYFLMKTFLVSQGDDPESDTGTDRRAENKAGQVEGVKCPECSGAMWDNRDSKRNPRAPDYKCKDRGCNGAVWEDQKESESEGEPNAEVIALREQIKKAMEALNNAGDEPQWDIPRVNQMVKENFNGKITARLTVHELGDLAQMFSQRLADLRGKMGIEATNLIAAIKSAETDEGIQSYLKEHHAGAALESLNIQELRDMDKAVGIPF